jgi:hypothetical protein
MIEWYLKSLARKEAMERLANLSCRHEYHSLATVWQLRTTQSPYHLLSQIDGYLPAKQRDVGAIDTADEDLGIGYAERGKDTLLHLPPSRCREGEYRRRA